MGDFDKGDSGYELTGTLDEDGVTEKGPRFFTDQQSGELGRDQLDD